MPETFEIRSKAFTIKWVDVPPNCKVEWKIRPLKNSINLGIYQQKSEVIDQNRNLNGIPHSTELIENLSTDEVNQLPYRFFQNKDQARNSLDLPSNSKKSNNTVSTTNSAGISLEFNLEKHLTKYKWIGRCPSDTIQKDVIESKNGGLFAFVFDNTFSKTKAKTVIFQYEIQPMESPIIPQPNSQDKELSVKFDLNTNTKSNSKKLNKSATVVNVNGVQYLEGYLMKRRRNNNKSGKHFNKRFFSLNLHYGILYYYSNEKSSIIRGNMMINQAVVSADSTELMFYLDSGMEQWVLKALNEQEFNTWVKAYNYIKNQHKQMKELQGKRVGSISEILSDDDNDTFYDVNSSQNSDDSENELSLDNEDHDNDNERPGRKEMNPQFKVVDEKIKSLKEMVKDLIKQDDFSELSPRLNPVGAQSRSTSTSTGNTRQRASTRGSESAPTNATMKRKPSFLNRLRKKTSSSSASIPDEKNGDETRGNSFVNTSPTLSSRTSSPTVESSSSFVSLSSKGFNRPNLDTVLEKLIELENEYEVLTRQESGNNKNRSTSARSLSRSTRAISIFSQEFFDAQEYAEEAIDGVVMIQSNESDIESVYDGKQKDTSKVDLKKLSFIDESSDESSVGSTVDEEVVSSLAKDLLADENIDDSKQDTAIGNDLSPLPYKGVFKPRSDIKPAACDPPSLISILRKGVGKDLSNMAMPITTNEPLSFLQTYAESLEYCNLINDAFNSPIETGERLLKLGAFAVSYLSSYKDKVRSTRKPFNPLLGETFELVRPDLNIRVITEKVIHKPFVMAAHVDSSDWVIDHNICPTQKFYGKTAEIIMDGTLRLRHKNGEVYEWSQPTTTMRNVISITGEKYTEPTEPITIKSNKGFKCVVNFISSNTRFSSSRSEKIELKVFDKLGKPLKLTASGTWTSHITLSTGETIWKAEPELHDHAKKYGFTKFACSLNHMDPIHEDSSPTDSRRRPDQRLYENGDVDKADILKKELEEKQRQRRKDANGNDVIHKPAFFKQGDGGKLDWTFNTGEDGYWSRRKRKDWNGVLNLW